MSIEAVSSGSSVRLAKVGTRPQQSDALVARTVPIWLNKSGGNEGRPTVRFGDEVLTVENQHLCSGRWQLHLFSFAAEARSALQTLAACGIAMPGEAGVRATGEGLLLLREGDGPFSCSLVDRRRLKDTEAPLGSWAGSADIGHQAALYVPRRSSCRLDVAVRQIETEFENTEELAELMARLSARRPQPAPADALFHDVVNSANRLLEPVEIELCCSDRKVVAMIERCLARLRVDVDGLVDRVAHELVAELAESGAIA